MSFGQLEMKVIYSGEFASEGFAVGTLSLYMINSSDRLELLNVTTYCNYIVQWYVRSYKQLFDPAEDWQTFGLATSSTETIAQGMNRTLKAIYANSQESPEIENLIYDYAGVHSFRDALFKLKFVPPFYIGLNHMTCEISSDLPNDPELDDYNPSAQWFRHGTWAYYFDGVLFQRTLQAALIEFTNRWHRDTKSLHASQMHQQLLQLHSM